MTTTTRPYIIATILFLAIVGSVGFVRPALIIPTALGVAAVLAVELRPQ